MPSPSVLRPRAIDVGELCGRIQAACAARRPRAGGRDGDAVPRSSSRRCPCSRQPTTTWLSTSPTRAADSRVHARADGARSWRRTSGPSPTLGRRATSRPSPVQRRAALVASSARLPCSELLAWLDENEPSSRTGPLPSRLSSRRAGDARSLRRGARDPRRDACRADRARRRTCCSRDITGVCVGLGRALGRRSRRGRRVRSSRGAGCTRSWGNRARCRPRLGVPGAGALRA